MYFSYLKNKISGNQFWDRILEDLLKSVIYDEISGKTIQNIFRQIDGKLNSKKVDLIIGGPSCQAYSLEGRRRDPKK